MRISTYKWRSPELKLRVVWVHVLGSCREAWSLRLLLLHALTAVSVKVERLLLLLLLHQELLLHHMLHLLLLDHLLHLLRVHLLLGLRESSHVRLLLLSTVHHEWAVILRGGHESVVRCLLSCELLVHHHAHVVQHGVRWLKWLLLALKLRWYYLDWHLLADVCVESFKRVHLWCLLNQIDARAWGYQRCIEIKEWVYLRDRCHRFTFKREQVIQCTRFRGNTCKLWRSYGGRSIGAGYVHVAYKGHQVEVTVCGCSVFLFLVVIFKFLARVRIFLLLGLFEGTWLQFWYPWLLLSGLLGGSCLELISIHTFTKLLGDFIQACKSRVLLFFIYTLLKVVDQTSIRCVVLRESNRETKFTHYLISLILHYICQVYEILIDHEGLLSIFNAHLAKTL